MGIKYSKKKGYKIKKSTNYLKNAQFLDLQTKWSKKVRKNRDSFQFNDFATDNKNFLTTEVHWITFLISCFLI